MICYFDLMKVRTKFQEDGEEDNNVDKNETSVHMKSESNMEKEQTKKCSTVKSGNSCFVMCVFKKNLCKSLLL